VKRNSKRISLEALKDKAESIRKPLEKYEVEYIGLSMDDM
jgi:hypothetical protein